MKKIAFIAMLSALASAGVQADEPAQMAMLSGVDGKVLVNKGKGFVSAKSGMVLNEGDRVVSLNGAQASVVYPDGCATQIKENSLLALDKSARCGKEAIKTGGAQQPLRYAQAIGGSANDAGGGFGGGGGASPLMFGGGFVLGSLVLHREYKGKDDTSISRR